MTPEELGMSVVEVQAAQAAAEASFPIADLYDELLRVVSIANLEDNTKISKQELKDAVNASRALSIKTGMLPRYDVYHNVFRFVVIRLDRAVGAYSILLPQWKRKYIEVIALYDYTGVS